ncbi:hypothetical protein PPL_10265 [Heterostelium album PN500]|uniref:Uncharacterized protein n=1 Tax=Heterostelium pallidum (strain ATCC 26659 / Pp 5 / PN500) TaxID=670386 RepID=D3BQS7_HETP5|nr:hypothetical protein PPL_10265 [Heterostelium album PN500]EFA76497.1 hypothetical protein PPL_10265 [Heterostelium album PN500]|eukprot:XP_020428629.1 hypothetical protein PPL_10265 [Heterostelium album PN500]
MPTFNNLGLLKVNDNTAIQLPKAQLNESKKETIHNSKCTPSYFRSAFYCTKTDSSTGDTSLATCTSLIRAIACMQQFSMCQTLQSISISISKLCFKHSH